MENKHVSEENFKTYVLSGDFENYCGSCDNFGTTECPHTEQVCTDTNWHEIGCTKFWD